MSYGDDVYSSPEKFGLEIVGGIDERDMSYEFNMFVVWRSKEHPTVVYYATDSGCSCPSPFENYTSVQQLTRVNSKKALLDAAKAWIDAMYDGKPGIEEIEALVAKVNPR